MNSQPSSRGTHQKPVMEASWLKQILIRNQALQAKSAPSALYARVSTIRDQNPEMQLRELREYASRRGWTVVGEFIDHGVSGSKDTRPQLNKLMVAAHRREFDAILCWKIDRFGRSLKHLVTALADCRP